MAATMQGIENKRTHELIDEELVTLREEVEKYMVEGELRKKVRADIQRLIDIGCYRGRRHSMVTLPSKTISSGNAFLGFAMPRTKNEKQRKDEKRPSSQQLIVLLTKKILWVLKSACKGALSVTIGLGVAPETIRLKNLSSFLKNPSAEAPERINGPRPDGFCRSIRHIMITHSICKDFFNTSNIICFLETTFTRNTTIP